MKAVFGQPESAGVLFVDPLLLEHATIVYRAIHTFETLRDGGKLGNGDDTPALFAEQSWRDLKRLLAYYQAQGVRLKDIDIGAFV